MNEEERIWKRELDMAITAYFVAARHIRCIADHHGIKIVGQPSLRVEYPFALPTITFFTAYDTPEEYSRANPR